MSRPVEVAALLALMSSAACSSSSHIEEGVLARIDRIESGLLPAVVVRGEEIPRSTIWEIMERYQVPGISVAVLNNGELEWAKAYGASEVGGMPVDTATLFLAGHIGHGVATVATLGLVDEGLLSLDRNVNDYLTSWRVPDNEYTMSEKVTLRRILNHTSGLSVPTLRGYSTEDTLPSLQQMLDSVPPARNSPIRVLDIPGSRQRYSLGGYIVLQLLLEDISGVPYADFVHTAVLTPLGMQRSVHSQPLDATLAVNAASGHEPTNERVPGRWRLYPELAALGMWTTPTDLARLVLELQNSVSERLVSRELIEEMLSPQYENRGLGFEVGGEGEWRFFRLEGHGNNYLSELYAYTSIGMGAVVMTNSSNGEGVKAHLLRAIAAEYGWPDYLPEEVDVVRLSDEALEQLEGRYRFRGRDRVLVVEQGRIWQQSQGDRREELLALSGDQLISVSFGYRYDIDRDASGAITGLTLVLHGTRLFTYERVN
ncbi:MAG: beta-lactamase family protein [Gemmatimonadota bacterium]|nr:MAG: beta-lactamase family protein [Gemmatimonadota bacterium]